MSRQLKRRIAVSVAAVALLAGGTAVALGATGGSHAHASHAHRGRGTLAAAASYLGIGRAQLGSDLRSGRSLAEIANTTPGRSETGLVAALVASQRKRLTARSARLTERVTAYVQKTGKDVARGAAGRRSLRSLALSYLGLEREQLARQLPGKSLAQVADATSGKSAAGLIGTVDSALEQRLRSATKSDRLSATAAREREATLLARVKQVVERVHAARSHRQR